MTSTPPASASLGRLQPAASEAPPAGRMPVAPSASVVIAAPAGENVERLADSLQALPGAPRLQRVEFLDGQGVEGTDLMIIHERLLEQPASRQSALLPERSPGLRILVFGADIGDERLVELVCAGVQGYLNGSHPVSEIRRAVEVLLAGGVWIEQRILARCLPCPRLLEELMASQLHGKIEQMSEELTRREKEILCQVIRGYAIKQIAAEVHLSHQGVKMHLARLFRKFGAGNRNQLILAVLDRISPMKNLSGSLCSSLRRKLLSERD